MNPTRWQQVKDVLTDALERADPAATVKREWTIAKMWLEREMASAA